MILLALKIALVIAVSGLIVFTVDYTRLTRGACWRDPVGQTIIIAEVLAALGFTPLLLAVFFRFSSLGSEIASWVLIVFWGLGGLAMYWRTLVFERIHRRGKRELLRLPLGAVVRVVAPDGGEQLHQQDAALIGRLRSHSALVPVVIFGAVHPWRDLCQ